MHNLPPAFRYFLCRATDFCLCTSDWSYCDSKVKLLCIDIIMMLVTLKACCHYIQRNDYDCGVFVCMVRNHISVL